MLTNKDSESVALEDIGRWLVRFENLRPTYTQFNRPTRTELERTEQFESTCIDNEPICRPFLVGVGSYLGRLGT